MENEAEMDSGLFNVAFGGNEDVDLRKRFQISVITLRDFLHPDSAHKKSTWEGRKKMLPVKKTENVSTRAQQHAAKL